MATRAERTADKALNRRHAKILGDLAREPGNRICADCHKKDPRWASWNLGVFICIRCSGIHRSLGTHISKVKSVDLDCWTPEQVENMQRWGNDRANAYWEANLRDSKRPTEYGMETWIRSKYEHKSFAMKGAIPEPEALEGAASELAPAANNASSATTQKTASKPEAKPAPSNNLLLMDLMDDPIPSASQTSSGAQVNDFFAGFNTTPVQQQQQQQPVKQPTDMDIFGSFTSAPSATSQQAQSASSDMFGFGATSAANSSSFASAASPFSNSTPSAPSGQPDLSNPNKDLKSYILSLYSQPSGGTGANKNSFGGL